MNKERYAIGLIMVAFFSGMILTAATSGCDTPGTPQSSSAEISADTDDNTTPAQ